MNAIEYRDLIQLASRAQIVLETNVLPFWKEALFNEQCQCFYSYIDENGKPDITRPLNAILLTRMLWAYSAAFEDSGDLACLKLADAAYKILLNSFRDPHYGGIFFQIQADSTPMVLQKRTFAQAFYIIALARYSKATGNNEAFLEACTTHQLLLQHAQIEKGGFTDTLARDWRNEKDEHIWWMNSQGAPFIFNSQLHMLEAAIELQEASPNDERSTQIKDQISFILKWFLDQGSNHLFVSISNRAIPMDDTISFSNELETAYLLRRAGKLCGEEDRVNQLCTTLVRNVMQLALDKTHGGLFFSFNRQQGLNRCKVWYVHAEAMVALLDAYEATADNYFLNHATDLWEYIEQHLVDWDGGEWFASAKNHYTDEVSIQQQKARDNRTGKEKASAYKCPYHTVRACLEIKHRVNQLTYCMNVQESVCTKAKSSCSSQLVRNSSPAIAATTFSILGDSISTFAGYVPEENELFYPKENVDVVDVSHTWWHILSKRTKLKLLINESYSGSRVSRTGNRPITSSFLDEKRQGSLCGDIIIIFGGTNDWGAKEQPATKEIFIEAYRDLVELMLQRHTKSELYFCTPLQRTDHTLTEYNIHGWTQTELGDIIRSIVAHYPKAHLIDLAIHPIMKGDGMLADGLHPTRMGMKMLASLIQTGLNL